MQASGAWPPQTSLRPLWERIGAGALVLLLSDCFDDTAVELAQKLAGARREVLSVQILTVSERDFAFAEGQRFVDPETGAELITDAPAARAEFLRRFATARAELAQRLAASGIRHCEWVLDQPLDQPLQRFFSARGQRASRASP